MKILFTADWHIKTTAKGVPVEWAKNKFRILFSEINRVEALADLHIIGGDIFDKIPNMDELELYFEFVSCAKLPTIIYSGNHEALRKDTTFLTALKDVTHRLNPKVTICDEPRSDLLGGLVDIIPYTHIKTFNPSDYSGQFLFTHVRGEIPPHVKPEIPLEKLKRWDVVLAGDLHSYENSQANILYPGSPATTSYHRNLTSTGCIIFDTDTQTHDFIEFNVPQLIKRTIAFGEPIKVDSYHHVVYEVEGSLEELASLKDDAIFTKKVAKIAKEAALMLDPKLTLVEELREYLLYIAALPEPTVDEIINEFIAHASQ